MVGKITRREALKILPLALGGTAWLSKQMLKSEDFQIAKAGDISPRLYFPLVSQSSNALSGKVVHIHAPAATNGWTGQLAYWDYVNQSIVDEMVQRGVTELTGKATIADAWRRIIPGYQDGQKIAIKVNFNNAFSCEPTNGVIDALIHPVNAVVSGLEQIGVQRSDVYVYDAIRHVPYRFINGGLVGVKYFDGINSGACSLPAGFTSQADHYVRFNPPPGTTVGAVIVTDVLFNAAYLINMPIMKGGHPIAGVTLGYKNHFGTTNNPSGMHTAVDVVSKPTGYNQSYNALVDLMACPQIGAKTVLTIGDGIYGGRNFNGPPGTWSTFGNKVPNSLFFSTDPVAVDCVMHDYLKIELGSGLVSDANRYLQLAANAGQGVFESVNPWNETYQQIDYIKIPI